METKKTYPECLARLATITQPRRGVMSQYNESPPTLIETIAVTNDKVYPISGKIAWLSGMDAFPSGKTYTAIRDTFAKVHKLKSCSDTR